MISAVVGSFIGAVVGYYQEGGGFGSFGAGFVMRAADVLQAFPVFVFAIALVAIFGQSLESIIAAIAFVNAPIYLRLMRSQVLAIRNMRYVEASYVSGALRPDDHAAPHHPQLDGADPGPALGQHRLVDPAHGRRLSFVGAGVVAPTPEWGSMIAMGFQNIITGQWWPSVFPGIALAVTVFGFALVGASVEVLADPARSARPRGHAARAEEGPRRSLPMRILRYIGRRFLFIGPQLFGIILVSFLLVKLIPGDPAVMMLGPFATEQQIAMLNAEMGLEGTIIDQFWIYLQNLVQGDLGTSWQTTKPVFDDLAIRFPATLELITLSLLLALLIGIPLGVAAAYFKRSIVKKFSDYYGLLAGSLPDFWLGLILIYLFYTIMQVAPAPLGRIDFAVLPPAPVTNFLIIDSLIAGNWQALWSTLGHLVLPVVTLAVINAGPILKMTQATMERMLESDLIRYAEMCGLPKRIVIRKAFPQLAASRWSPSSACSTAFLIGGAVLVEIVFSWGGAGQYAVQGVLNADINPVLGFVLFSAILSLIIYLLVDLIYFAIDPRIRG